MRHVTALTVVAATLVLTPSAGAKLGLSFAISPAPPVAREPARVTLRASASGATVPRRHGLRLTAVSTWRGRLGQTVLDVPLVRTGPRTLRTTIRFPHRGRWTLIVPNEPSSGWFVRVRPARS